MPTLCDDVAVLAAVAAIVLIPTLWGLRHRPAIRRRLRDVPEGHRAYVYAVLSLSDLLPGRRDERELVEQILHRLKYQNLLEGPSQGTPASGHDLCERGDAGTTP